MSDAPELHPAVERVRDAARERLTPADWLAFSTDTTTFGQDNPKAKRPPTCLLAIATPVGSVVIAIDRSEWLAAMDTVLEHAGCVKPAAKTAMERAQK